MATIALESSGREKALAEFLEHSCLHYGIRPATSTWDRAYRDEPSRWNYAARILAEHTDLATDSINAAAVSGDAGEVARILAKRPEAVHEKGGRQAWEPLLYVCYGRLPLPAASANAVAIAHALLDAGASVNVLLPPSECHFGPLTGAIGAGEQSQPAHPEAAALVELLIERGADPYDTQALYDIALEGEDTFWLDFLYDRSARRNETHKWTAKAKNWPQSGMLDYLLGNFVTRNAIERARWVFARGANANITHFYTKRKVHTEAVMLGFTSMAKLLEGAGAVPEMLRGTE